MRAEMVHRQTMPQIPRQLVKLVMVPASALFPSARTELYAGPRKTTTLAFRKPEASDRVTSHEL